jgi:3-hydroxymyristoyl/3-hydroxydecanoyl-(acyl carrier protein) dehydratase
MEGMMNASWSSSQVEPEILDEVLTSTKVTLHLFAASNLFQFQGHFPEKKILPGVAQLDWAVRYGLKYFNIQQDVQEIAQLKYRRLIGPDANVFLSLEYNLDKNRLSFKYSNDEDVFSSGIIKLG